MLLYISRAFLGVQTAKRLLAVQETWVQPLGMSIADQWKDPRILTAIAKECFVKAAGGGNTHHRGSDDHSWILGTLG